MSLGLGPFNCNQVENAFSQAYEDAAMNSINDQLDGDELVHRLVCELQMRSEYYMPLEEECQNKSKTQKSAVLLR